MLFLGRQYEAAVGAARRALRLEPGRLRATAFLGDALFMLGRIEDAQRALQAMPATITVVWLERRPSPRTKAADRTRSMQFLPSSGAIAMQPITSSHRCTRKLD